jgi:hypothetical protein
MNKKDMELIQKMVAETVISVITAKKQETPVKTGVQTPKTPPKEKIDSPPHTKKDIPTLLNAMTPQDLKDTFGDMTQNPKETPYKVSGITKWYETNNIQLKNKFDRISLTYSDKHLILLKQLSTVKKGIFNTVKANCLNSLREKLKTIPETNRYGQEMSDKQRESIENALNSEIARWNDGTKTE